jgi:DNA-directed RNA polymerase I, II, and III subunit RPABC1
MSSTDHIISIYKSRGNLLEILEERGFDTSEYNNFTITEIGILTDSNQLDMLVENKTTKKKTYVKYYINKIIKPPNMYSMVEDLFYLENLLNKPDDLMIIIKDEPNDTLIQNVKDIWMDENIYISLINIKRLQFNILKHESVPKHTILSAQEASDMKKKYNIIHDKQIPDISYFSPVSIVMGIRPGDIVKIDRFSRTAINAEFYRLCKI